MRRLAALALALLCLLSGCSSRTEPQRITLVLKTPVETAEFWEEALDGAYAAAEELGVALEVASAPSEMAVDEQIDLMEQAIDTLPDAIILVASEYVRLNDVTNQAVAAGIPVVTMDSDVSTDARSCFVASDNYEIGQTIGGQLKDLIPSGQVAVLTHSGISSSGINRVEGIEDALEGSGITIVEVADCQNSLDLAREQALELLERYPDLAGFACVNEVCNLGAAEALTDLDLGGRLVVVGCDNSQQQIQYLEQGVIQAIVIQRPFNMGYLAVEQALQVCMGRPVSSFTEIPCVAITQENMYNSENQKLLFPF